MIDIDMVIQIHDMEVCMVQNELSTIRRTVNIPVVRGHASIYWEYIEIQFIFL